MDAGRARADEVVIGVAEERLGQPDAGKGFILDGFPRTSRRPRRSTTCSSARGTRSNAAWR